jgi:hypothetical protein
VGNKTAHLVIIKCLILGLPVSGIAKSHSYVLMQDLTVILVTLMVAGLDIGIQSQGSEAMSGTALCNGALISVSYHPCRYDGAGLGSLLIRMILLNDAGLGGY